MPSRSLPLLPQATDRGRAKTRIDSEPDATHTLSVSLPPIRSAVRGSRDEECGPLPGISSIIDQSEKTFPTQRPARRLSETGPRVYYSSPGRELDRQIEIGRTAASQHSPWNTPRQTRPESTSGTDASLSRPSSPEAASTLSSSYSTIASVTSLTSILEDRSACASPGPIQLPGFAQLDSTLPPLGPKARSAFELSDLRTSLPSDESALRSSISRTRFRSPRSTPLPLSRPMSPALSSGGSPHVYPLTRRLRIMKVTTDEDYTMDQLSTRSTSTEPLQIEQPDDTAPIKFETETISPPRSPASKGLESPNLYVNTVAIGGRDDMSCTPTQTQTALDHWPKETSPTTETATSPSTPIMRESPSPFTSTMSPSTRESSPPMTEPEEDEEDSKSGILKPEPESDGEGVGAGAKHRERQARRRANAAAFDPSAAQARSGPNFYFPHGAGYMMPLMDPVAQLAQQAEQFGFKLQPDPTRLPAQLQTLRMQQMLQRRQRIEQLQREEQEDVAAMAGISSAWGPPPPPPPPDMHLGMMAMAELGPAQPLHLSDFNTLPLGMSQQDTLDTTLGMPLLGHDGGFLDYSSPSPLFQSEFAPNSFAPPSLTSSSSPGSSFSLASPPPLSLPSSVTGMEPFRASAETIGRDDQGQNSSTHSTGTGTHKCESCGKTFRRPSGLKDHMNIHSGEKPYCCPLETCRKGFATRSNMIRHHNKTHPNRAKIGGVADINADVDDGADINIMTDGESSLANSTGSLTAITPTSTGGGSSSQGRFRVVQQNMSKAAVIEAGVGPMRANKERRAGRRPTISAQLL